MGVPLTDLESVKQFLQETEGDDQDDDIERLIVQASDAIPRYCKREFGRTDGKTRGFEYMPEYDGLCASPTIVDFRLYEVREVSTIVIDPELNGGVELAATAWRLWPLPETLEATFLGVRLGDTIPRPSGHLAFPTRRVDVTADWGMGEVPEIVRRYANETVASWLQLPPDGRAFNEAEMGGEAPARPDDLPPSVRFGLRNFKRDLFSA